MSKCFQYLKLLLLLVFMLSLLGCRSGPSFEDNNATTAVTNPEVTDAETGYPISPAYPALSTQERLSVTTTRIVEVSAPQPDRSTLTGLVISERSNNPIAEVPVQLAEVYYEGDAGAFVLDTAQSPTTYTDGEGRFVFVDIPAQDYVIVIGNAEIGDYMIVAENNNQAKIWSTVAGEILDTGDHFVLLERWE